MIFRSPLPKLAFFTSHDGSNLNVPVLQGDDVEALATRSLIREHVFWVETLERVLTGAIG